MDLRITGKRALVTGASSGLGLAAASALAAEGVRVTINSRSRERLEAAAARIKEETGAKVNLAAGDISSPGEVPKIIAAVGEVDILVSNCGGPPPGPFTDHSDETWQQGHELVLQSAIRLTRGVIGGMRERGWGRLIYITSIAVLQPVDDLIISNTYRAGLTGFVKTVSNTWARYGITANTVCPGYTGTDRLRELAKKRAEAAGKTPEEAMADFGKSAPVGRVGRPDELAALITFLASERAAYITGTAIPVDGGVYKGLV